MPHAPSPHHPTQRRWAEHHNRQSEWRYWRRWNLDYTKRVLVHMPQHPLAAALLRCWSPRVQHALLARYPAARAALPQASPD